MNYEEASTIEVKKVMAREEIEPLMIRTKKSNPMVVINTHKLIVNDPKLAPRYLVVQEQALTHFEYMFRLLGGDSMQAC